MATRFSTWIDSPNAGTGGNIQGYDTFANDSQRINGFVTGTAASALRVNTALRQALLVTTALMDVIGPSSTVDVSSSVADVKTVIQNYFNSFITSVSANNVTAGTFAGKVQANTTAEATLTDSQLRNITISTSSPSSSAGNVGDIWIVYEA